MLYGSSQNRINMQFLSYLPPLWLMEKRRSKPLAQSLLEHLLVANLQLVHYHIHQRSLLLMPTFALILTVPQYLKGILAFEPTNSIALSSLLTNSYKFVLLHLEIFTRSLVIYKGYKNKLLTFSFDLCKLDESASQMLTNFFFSNGE